MRSIFVCTDTGKEIVDWYMAIRAVQLANFRIVYPTCQIADLLPLLSTDFIKEGFLHKTGSKVGDEYKRRWFSLHRRVLLYFVEPTVRCLEVDYVTHAQGNATISWPKY